MVGNWAIQLEDGQHTVKADLSMITGRMKVYFDNTLIHSAYVMLIWGEIARVAWHNHMFAVRIQGLGAFGQLLLHVDDRPVAVGSTVAPGPPPAGLSPSFPVLAELPATDMVEVIGMEEFPLDNRAGAADLTMEQEVSKTINCEMQIEHSVHGSAQLGFDLLQAIKVQLGGELAAKVGRTSGETIVRRQMLRFTARAQSKVVYVVTWKRKTRTGQYILLVNGLQTSVPYRISYDLMCDIDSRLG